MSDNQLTIHDRLEDILESINLIPLKSTIEDLLKKY